MKPLNKLDNKTLKVLSKTINVAGLRGVNSEFMTIKDALALAENFYLNRKSALAIPLFERIIHTAPKLVPAYFTMAGALIRSGRRKEARAIILKALQVEPKNIVALLKAGEHFESLYENERAFECYAKAYHLMPNNPDTMSKYAEVLLKQNRQPDAIKLWKQVLLIEPQAANSYARLAEYEPDFFNEENLHKLLKLAESPQLNNQNKAAAQFALAKVYKKRGDLQQEFKSLDKANAYLRLDSTWTWEVEVDTWRQTRSVYTAEFLRSIQSTKSTEIVPIIFATLPRSGGTLMERIISSHDKVCAAGESHLFTGAIREASSQLFPTGRHREWISQDNCKEFIKRFVDSVYNVMDEQSLHKQFVTDKTITNYVELGIMLAAFPEAKVIHCIRHPLDICLSCYEHHFGLSNESHTSLEDMARMCKLFDEIMDYWKSIFPERILSVNYRELVNQPEEIAREMIAFCGLDWQEACLKFHENKQIVHTASLAQVTSPINSKGLDRWKKYESFLGPAIEILGKNADK